MSQIAGIDWEWAGVRFLVLAPDRVEMFREPALFALVKRHASGFRTILYVDHEPVVASIYGTEKWRDAIALGFDEFHICLSAQQRIDGLILKSYIVKREEPILNLSQSIQLDDAAQNRRAW